MQNAQITFQVGTLPEGICFSSEQQRFSTYFQFVSGYLPGTFTTIVVSSTTPTVDQQGYAWLKVNADGSPIDLFTFSNGAWVAPYWPPPSSNLIVLWNGAAADVDTFDGGTAGAVTDTTGPFWTIVTALTDKVPVGAGTLAVNTNANYFSTGTDAPQFRGIYFLKRTARKFKVG